MKRSPACVHPDAAPHHRVEHGLAVGRHDARSEPRLVEQGGVGADVDAGEQRVAGVAGDAGRPLVGHRRLVLLAELAVALRTRRRRAARRARRTAEPFRRRSTASTPTTRPSSTIRLVSAVFVRTSPLPVSMKARRPRPIRAWPPTIVSGGLDAPPFGPQRSPHEWFEVAELGTVDVRGEDRAALAECAGRVGEVVGNAAPLELADRRIGLQLLDHPRTGFEVGLAQRDRGVVADDRVEIRASGVGAPFEAGAHLGRVPGQPDAGAGVGGRAADERRLLDHERAQTARGPRRRRRTARRPSRRRSRRTGHVPRRSSRDPPVVVPVRLELRHRFRPGLDERRARRRRPSSCRASPALIDEELPGPDRAVLATMFDTQLAAEHDHELAQALVVSRHREAGAELHPDQVERRVDLRRAPHRAVERRGDVDRRIGERRPVDPVLRPARGIDRHRHPTAADVASPSRWK